MSRVLMDKRGIFVDNQAKIILCGSLFYYRIPNHLWEDRMRKFKQAGYNCIDVYFPWNFHEAKEGQWNFTGDRDVERFLQLAKEYDLYVVARPGPYICGEWDGGGLPAYLYTKDMKVRDYDHRFLEYVDKWFQRIVPIIAKYQLDQGGTVLTFQVENELDFYKRCEEPRRYIAELKDMAQKYGITVPIFACAGDFDVEGATGYAEGVIPAINIYPDLGTPKLESRSIYYYEYMQERNYPLMVTETSREHNLLRRLMLNGTKLLGPFNQVGGTCFGFTNAINNWGRPLSFLSSDYNFGGLINGQGEVSREFYDARLLSNFINFFQEKLGQAQMVKKEVKFLGKQDVQSYPYLMEFHGGGYVTTATNYGNDLESIKVKIAGKTYPKNCDIQLKRLKAPFILWDTPLDFLGIDTRIKFSSLELSQHFKVGNRHVLVTYTDHVGEMQLIMPEDTIQSIQCDGGYELENGKLIISLHANESCHINTDNFNLTIHTLTPQAAALVDEVNEKGLVFIKDEHVKSSQYLKPLVANYRELALKQFRSRNYKKTDEVKHMEQYGRYRGYANYHFKFADTNDIIGLLVNEVSDVCSIYLNENYLGTDVTCNNHHYVSLTEQDLQEANDLLIRTEIWGHTNFHDEVLPSLHINSLKGLTGVTLIKQQREIQGSWSNCGLTLKVHLPPKQLTTESVFLKICLEHRAKVEINGEVVGHLSRMNNIVDLNAHLNGVENVIKIYTKKQNAIPNIQLLLGEQAELTGVNFLEEADLRAFLNESGHVATKLPLSIKPGKLGVLKVDLPHLNNANAYLYPQGKNLKLTAFYNGRLVSRVWLDSPNRPQMVGGNPNMVYLPSHPSEGDNQVVFFMEAVNKDEEARLNALIVNVLNN